MYRTLMNRFPVCCRWSSTHILYSGSNRDSSLHIRVNITVVGECSRRGEGELEGLVLCDIARGTEDPGSITGDGMGSIRGIEPHYLRAHFDRQCRRLERVLLIRLHDLHCDNRWGRGRSRARR